MKQNRTIDLYVFYFIQIMMVVSGLIRDISTFFRTHIRISSFSGIAQTFAFNFQILIEV